jgi:hypothetical protein
MANVLEFCFGEAAVGTIEALWDAAYDEGYDDGSVGAAQKDAGDLEVPYLAGYADALAERGL